VDDRLTIRLSPADRDRLDRLRGFRSRGATIRALIREAAERTPPPSAGTLDLRGRIEAAEREAALAVEEETDRMIETARRVSTR